MSIARELAEEQRRKILVERLVLGLTCRKYNLLYENEERWKMWKFSFQEINEKFQVFAVRRTWYNDVGYPYTERNWKIKQITLSSPVGNIEQMHFWLAGIVNVFGYIEEEGLAYQMVAIA
jgi:hypothetical protein